MKNLAPSIFRQRLLIEGYYTVNVNEETVKEYFNRITKDLGLKMYAQPTIHSTDGQGKEDNQGFDAFVPLIDSGISVYIWTKQKFFSGILYTCKKFDQPRARRSTSEFFKMDESAYMSF